MFEIGQRVVCINDQGRVNLKEGDAYIVNDISNCCQQSIYVGLKISLYKQTCKICGDISGYNGDRAFYFSTRFAPIEDMEEATEAVNKLIKEVNEPVKLKSPLSRAN